MNVPPFPSQDLAKLVLGYLAEEQLMTAYDEFLQASPYLDALLNEYDRIFMTSLKCILAEYRAAKICVETCRPYSLRRRLFGCPNLLEVVKFLIQNVDLNKINMQDASRVNTDGKNITLADRSSICAVCNSLKLPSCVCKSRHSSQTLPHSSNVIEPALLDSSVETTSLEDLPGNHDKRKHKKVITKGSKLSQSALSYDLNNDSTSGSQTTSDLTLTNNTHIRSNSHISAQPLPTQSSQRIDTNIVSNVHDCNRLSSAGTFQDFSNGVRGIENVNPIVPDSSTSENISTQTMLVHESTLSTLVNDNNLVNKAKTLPKAHIFLTVGTINSNVNSSNGQKIVGNTANDLNQNYAAKLKLKPNDQKVTILSDIKVDKTFDDPSMPAVLKNASSTPLMNMQTILINGTPVYKQQPQPSTKRNFTKDEIMAMPTIIVVPTSGPSSIPPTVNPQATLPEQLPTCSAATSQSLEPLTIDVLSESQATKQNMDTGSENLSTLNPSQETGKVMLVKTVDMKNASAPKDNAEFSNKNTPQVLPPLRKSSSTPRRSSHVRVLDFATPRRILEEAIGEQCESSITPIEVIISRSPNLHTLADRSIPKIVPSNESNKANDDVPNIAPGKKPNWDADLRALATQTNKKEDIPISRIQPRCRPRPKIDKKHGTLSAHKKSKVEKVKTNEKVNKSTNMKRKCQQVIDESVVVGQETVNIPIKPTINIINGPDWNSQESDKSQSVKNHDEPSDTPEMERIALQNVIGAKLNISDLLETPYKQALYDIQMETPRFLGPDLLGEPMSDIKIMNIPTPRFLNDTPKPITATPSSYSSRPTDYSSGGSYYKPDEQDYIPVGDLGYPKTASKEIESVKCVNETPTAKEKSSKSDLGSIKSSRPVRSCAKNVSYYNSLQNIKAKEIEGQSYVASSYRETAYLSKSKEKKIDGERKLKLRKSDKKSGLYRKRKTPVKKETSKSFIKIKPRRITPIKNAKNMSRTSEGQGRKRTTSKESANATPVVISAPTKSRRKSSTPRKLHCTKNYNSESFIDGNESPEVIPKSKPIISSASPTPDSDIEQLPLRWSDDASQDTKPNGPPLVEASTSITESEDIPKIKEYIASELQNYVCKTNDDVASNLHVDLVKRGFDIETARIIERDLLDTPPYPKENLITNLNLDEAEKMKDDVAFEKTIESDTSSNLKIVSQEEEVDCDEIELSVCECTEESENFITCHHDDFKDMLIGPPANLKEKFSMEICIDDDLTVRLRATPFSVVLDQHPQGTDIEETEMAVKSISNIDKLYTPLKESFRAQVYEIFDSTLTSLDTPLKSTSPKRKSVTEIVLEVEKVDDKEKIEAKKRKRQASSDSDDPNKTKKTKPEAQYLLNSANIQNIDIETVLSKLHGP